MGMFDYVRCEFPLAEPELQGVVFQTKDFPEPHTGSYRVTPEGELLNEWTPHRDDLVMEVVSVDVRNKWAHKRPFSTDDVYRALDSISRLLTSISAAAEADELEKTKQALLRLKFDEQVRSEKRRSASTPLEGQPVSNLKPWHEVVTPHSDVAKGSYHQAEFAADLWQGYLGEGSDECRDPVE